jgi:hypothetical protein
MRNNDILSIRPEHTHPGGLQICDDGSDGTEQKLGFFGTEPTPQRANADQAKLPDNATLAQAVKLLNEIRDALVEKGIIKGEA